MSRKLAKALGLNWDQLDALTCALREAQILLLEDFAGIQATQAFGQVLPDLSQATQLNYQAGLDRLNAESLLYATPGQPYEHYNNFGDLVLSILQEDIQERQPGLVMPDGITPLLTPPIGINSQDHAASILRRLTLPGVPAFGRDT